MIGRRLGGLLLLAGCSLESPLSVGEGLVASVEGDVVRVAIDPARVLVIDGPCTPGDLVTPRGPGEFGCTPPGSGDTPSEEALAAAERRLGELQARVDGLEANPPARPVYRVPAAACHQSETARQLRWLAIADGRVTLVGAGHPQYGVSLYCPLPAPVERWTRVSARWADPDAAGTRARISATVGSAVLDTATSTTTGPTWATRPAGGGDVDGRRFLVLQLHRGGAAPPSVVEVALHED